MYKSIRPDEKFFCSWSGGKDSCLALYRCVKSGAVPEFLLTMMREDGMVSRSHGLTPRILHDQAESLGIPLIMRKTSWQDYGANFTSGLDIFKDKGIGVGVFGDIDVEEHREWVERICGNSGMSACLPLWQEDRARIVKELISEGFECVITMVRNEKLNHSFLGRTLDAGIIDEFIAAGVDPCGENGEYHTVVTNGPIFRSGIRLDHSGIKEHSGCSFLSF